MHAVVHDMVEPGTYKYLGESLKNWGSHSNLLSIIRQMHQEFQTKAPIPVGHKDLQNNNQAQEKEQEVEVQIEEEPKEPADEGEKFGLPEVKMRTEAERRDYVQQKLEKYKEFQVSEVISQTMETLSALPITEL